MLPFLVRFLTTAAGDHPLIGKNSVTLPGYPMSEPG